MLVSYFCFRICFPRENVTPILARMLNKWLYSVPLVTADYQETEGAFGYLFVDNQPDTPGNKQLLSDILSSCRVYPSINKSSKPKERVETRLSKNVEVTTSCVTQFSRRTHKYFDLVWSEASCPVVQNYITKLSQKDLASRKCTPLPEIPTIPVFLQCYLQERDTGPSS